MIVMVIRENYLAKIRPFIGKDIIKVLTGIRRGGKSVLLEHDCLLPALHLLNLIEEQVELFLAVSDFLTYIVMKGVSVLFYTREELIVMVIRETYLAKIRPFIGKDIIKVLTGIRRGGKSVLLEQIRDEVVSWR